MESLFDKTFKYTREAHDLSNAARGLIQSLMESHVRDGYSPCEVSHVLHYLIFDCEMEALLGIQEEGYRKACDRIYEEESGGI